MTCEGKNTIITSQIKICCDSRRDRCPNAFEVILTGDMKILLCFLNFDKTELTYLSKEKV